MTGEKPANPHRLAAAWRDFSQKVIGDESRAPAQQVLAMRTAFYAGAYQMYRTLVENVTDGDEVQEEDMLMMEHLHDEIRDFAERSAAIMLELSALRDAAHRKPTRDQ